jgi:uncharacterized protein (TIGR02679 family)
VIRAGVLRSLDTTAALHLVRGVRRLVDRLGGVADAPLGRVDLAAALFGSSHALDSGTRLEAASTRALRHLLGPARSQELWERAGVHLDLTSAPVLTWALPLCGTGGLVDLATAAARAEVPLHLTQLALRHHPVGVPRGTDILVCENPRIVEAAAQAAVPSPVVATNGNPSGAVLLLLRQLLDAGARLRYHGDFDAAGLAICARLHAMGLVPWRMDLVHYLDALATADAQGVELPSDPAAAPVTPWDPALQPAFDVHRRIVHEERLLDELLVTGS